MIQELNENIIGIDFIHTHKLTYDVISRRVKCVEARTNSNVVLKNSVTGYDLHRGQGKVQRDQR
jgi:hypothetical protein